MKERPSPPRILLVGPILLLVSAACAAQVLPTASSLAPETPATATAKASATPGPTASPSLAASAGNELDLTTDPFTVLVLGMDYEGRTDAIAVVGVDVKAKSVALASIPRDTINVPLPDGGTFHNKKINAFYNAAKADKARFPLGPARATADMVGGMLGIRIDYTASTTFSGFSRLTKAMGGVTITLPKAIVDPHYEITPTDVGVRFPKGKQKLNGQRALIYVRTRYSDNDFERQRRQQAFLLAAGKQLLSNPELLTALGAARSNLTTDFPVERLPAVLAAIGSLDGWSIQQVVLGPKKYESAASCPCGYSLAPKLKEMRAVSAKFFPWAVTP